MPDALAQEALAAGRLVLADRELTPSASWSSSRPARASRAQTDGSTGTTRLTGHLRPLKARESRLFLDRAVAPAKLAPAQGARHAIVVGRPLLADDVARISASQRRAAAPGARWSPRPRTACPRSP